MVEAPHTFDPDTFADEGGNGGTQVRTEGGSTQVRTERRRPSFGITLFTVLLPVGLMLGKALVDIFIDDNTQWFRRIFDTVGTPLLALLIAVIVGMITLGRGAGMTRKHLTMAIESGLPPVAGIILIVAAGGGFKQVLVDSGIGTLLARWAEGAHFPVIVLAWILAVLIRLATGSATVATITASSLIIGLVEGMSTGQVSLRTPELGAVRFTHNPALDDLIEAQCSLRASLEFLGRGVARRPRLRERAGRGVPRSWRQTYRRAEHPLPRST